MSTATDDASVVDCRVDRAADQLVASRRPRFAWRVDTDRPGAAQSGYQVRVARSPEAAVDRPDVWDSGFVGKATSAVRYDGPALDPATPFWWTVTVWDDAGTIVDRSEPHRFETAPDPSSWHARWISYQPDGGDVCGWRSRWHEAEADSAPWVAVDLGGSVAVTAVSLTPATAFDPPRTPDGFRVTEEFGADAPPEGVTGFGFPAAFRIEGAATADFAEPTVLAERDAEDPPAEPVRIDLEGHPCRHLRIVATDPFVVDPAADASSYKPDRLGQSWGRWAVFALAGLAVEDADGNDLTVDADVSASSSVESDTWSADAIATEPGTSRRGTSSPLLRTTLSLDRPVKRARAHVAGLGYGELYVNGERIGDRVLDPGLTEYDERVLFSTYAIDEQLQHGENAFGLWLGRGWFDKHARVWGGQGSPRAIARIKIEFEDGSTRTLETDGSWRAASSPIVANDIWDGEQYDARAERDGWIAPGFDDANWAGAVEVPGPDGRLVPQRGPPMRVTERLDPEDVTAVEDGWIIDFGQNLTGWVAVELDDPDEGDRIELTHAETLTEDGTLARIDLRSADARDVYVARGDAAESYTPRFTYHGFRYAKLVAPDGVVDPGSVTAEVVHTDMERAGEFSCSNRELTQVQRNAVWGLRGNVHSIPTDCPQRDERMGWTGDGHIAARALQYNFDAAGFHAKWMRDHADAQSPHGELTDTVPHAFGTRPSDPTWSITRVLIPLQLYRRDGDRSILEDHYPGMRRYVEFWEGHTDEDGLLGGEHANYGDWLAFELTEGSRGKPFELFTAAFHYYVTALLAEAAEALDHPGDVERYRARLDAMREAFIDRFYDPESATFGPGTQSSSAVPLFVGLVPDEEVSAVVNALAENVREAGPRLLTGFLGTRPLLTVLAEHGHAELAYDIVSTPEQPGWVYMVRQGATTMWERWDSDTRVGSGMNSYNHSPFTFVSEWFYAVLAGIDADQTGACPGTLTIAPTTVEDLDRVVATVRYPQGSADVRWERTDDGIKYVIAVPWNMTADVALPGPADATSIVVGDEPIDADTLPAGIERLALEDDVAVGRLGAGEYVIEVA